MSQYDPSPDFGSLPGRIPIFPLARALVLPRAQLPLNIFEPRYLAMIDDALGGDRMVGMIQPSPVQPADAVAVGPSGLDKPELCDVGCLARIVSFRETGDGRYLIALDGLCRFRIAEELAVTTLYRQVVADYSGFDGDMAPPADADRIDRDALLNALKSYLERQDLSADWAEVARSPTEDLVNSLTMSCPFEIAEKQALLEAPGVADRTETLTALLQMAGTGTSDSGDTPLQ